MTSPTDMKEFEELDHRENDGIEVSLLWCRDDNTLAVIILDTRTAETLELAVEADRAMDVFHHPFAYASSRKAAAQFATEGVH